MSSVLPRCLCWHCSPPLSPVWISPSFFFSDPSTTEIYTLSLHDALPIFASRGWRRLYADAASLATPQPAREAARSEEHTSELQSPDHLVCRLLLEKKRCPP